MLEWENGAKTRAIARAHFFGYPHKTGHSVT
jgi:hypothetical protein